AGDALVAGSINRGDALEMTVKHTGVDTMLGTISRLSERARYARPDFVQLADRIASYVVVAILVVAAAVALVWAYVDPARAFVVTLSVLVVTCPCALALATPAAFAAAGSRLAELKLLLTNGNAIEVLSKATMIVFDKTGTLTTGRPAITSVRVLDAALDEQDCRRIAAALEADSTHPLADAFRDETAVVASDLRIVAGRGVEGDIDGSHWRLGNAQFAAAGATDASDDQTTVWLANDAGPVAEFRLSDDLRSDAAETVGLLRRRGLRVRMLSGDAEGPVRAAARALGIDDFEAGCAPERKLENIAALQADGEIVVMVGDGINDAPVLAGADASIAPAHAARLAQTSADIITLGESLLPVATAVRAADRTMRIVRQNLAWAIVYNAVALPLAAAGAVPPWLAAIGMSTSSLVVVVNALRLNRFS
ncbi:MAG: heavy metal translocating P-type ATPase, partial [Woeseiaceae bacterium]|nr:heavy metal translocating P-type ATPase [Woeseiaceae bacterium]